MCRACCLLNGSRRRLTILAWALANPSAHRMPWLAPQSLMSFFPFHRAMNSPTKQPKSVEALYFAVPGSRASSACFAVREDPAASTDVASLVAVDVALCFANYEGEASQADLFTAVASAVVVPFALAQEGQVST